MSRPIADILPPKPEITPRLYAYAIDAPTHAGLLKIGQTTRDVAQRIAEQSLPDAAATQSEVPREIEIRGQSGDARNLMVSVRRMVFAGQDARLLSLADVTYMRAIEEQLRLLNDKLMQLATTDPLTGVSNRRHFLESVEAEILRMQRGRRPSVIFMLDLDYFKQVNDRFGHAAGDMVLGHMAKSVRQILRAHDLFGRLGGEEFAGFLPDLVSSSLNGAFARPLSRVQVPLAAAFPHRAAPATPRRRAHCDPFQARQSTRRASQRLPALSPGPYFHAAY